MIEKASMILFAALIMVWHGTLCQAIDIVRPSVAKSQADPQMIVGINRVNLAWKTPQEQHEIIDRMKDAGVHYVRFNLVHPFDQSLEAVRYATQNGMQVLMVINLGDDVFYPASAAMGPVTRKHKGRHRLSTIDPALFEAALIPVFRQLDDEKVSLLAIEVGNEINWGDFNGDFASHLNGEAKATRDLAAMSNRAAIIEGFRRYVELVHTVRQLMQASRYNHNAFLLSAGLSDVPAAFAEKIGLDMLPADQTLHILQHDGLSSLVDAYALHTYPILTESPTARKAGLGRLTSSCSVGPDGRPCWITEWGIPNLDTSCPANVSRQTALIQETRQSFTNLYSEGRIKAIFYFDWYHDGKDVFRVWRCGHFDSAGKAAIALEK